MSEPQKQWSPTDFGRIANRTRRRDVRQTSRDTDLSEENSLTVEGVVQVELGDNLCLNPKSHGYPLTFEGSPAEVGDDMCV